MKWEQLKTFFLQPIEPMVDRFLTHGLDSKVSESEIREIINSAVYASMYEWAPVCL